MEKEKIGIVADEGGDLPTEIIEQYGISIVPFKVDLGEMKDLPGNIYQKIREAEKRGLKSFVKTSQPSPGDFLKAFQEKLKEKDKIICITVTSKHSGTFNSALQAREILKDNKEKIVVVDSQSISGGEGLIILKALSLIQMGLQFSEILKRLQEAILKTNFIFMLENPKWAENSGRIPKILGTFLRKMHQLKLFPILGLKQGKVKLFSVKRKVKSMAEALFEEFRERISKKEYQTINLAITHAENEKEKEHLEGLIKKVPNSKLQYSNLIGEIVGGLAGPGALSLAWQYD